MKILDFKMLQGDGILEARIEHGYYHIFAEEEGFTVSFVIGANYYHIGKFPDIYAALDAANKNYNTEPPITDRQMGRFKEHVYLVTGRYPLDTGENYTKSDIDAMFKLTYPAGTELYLDKDNRWCLVNDEDVCWSADGRFAKKNIEKVNGKLN